MEKKETDEKVLTWQNIKDLANALNDEQLKNPVRWWAEDEGGKIDDANMLPEDYVSDGESYSPRSEIDETLIDENEPVLPEGTPMLWRL